MVAILVMGPGFLYIHWFPFLYFIQNLALISQAVSEEVFEYYGNIEYTCVLPGDGADEFLGSTFFFKNHKYSVQLQFPARVSLKWHSITFPHSNA